MSAVFIDTAYLVALINSADRHHAEAKRLAEVFRLDARTFVTTDAVLLEFANFFCRSPLRSTCATAIARLRGTKGWKIVTLERALFAKGEARFTSHRDKSWSLTDCISFEVMSEARLEDVATTDAHFAQAGFRVLLRDER